MNSLEVIEYVYFKLAGNNGLKHYCEIMTGDNEELKASVRWLENMGIINPTLGFDDEKCEDLELSFL